MAFQRFRWLIVLLVALIAAPAPLLALQPSPTSGDTQLYIGHSAKLTAQIPADWEMMPEAGVAYGDRDGMFASMMTFGSTLQEACDVTMLGFGTGEDWTTTETTWNGDPACEIDAPTTSLGIPLSWMVIPHPEPYTIQGSTVTWVAVYGTPEHLDDILSTVSFDLSDLTGPQIAHDVLDIAEANALYGDEIDWAALREAADDVESPNDVSTFLSRDLVLALNDAGDNHSFLWPPVTGEVSTGPFSVAVPTGAMRGQLGYINIPAGTTPDNQEAYVDAGLSIIADLDAAGACGWIVDLRDNTGGQPAVMFQSLLPFFPKGSLAGILDASGETTWIARYGDLLVLDHNEVSIPYTRRTGDALPVVTNPDAPIAVLISRDTSSAAEYTLLALMTRSTTRTFGQPTGGFTTGTTVYPMLDGSTLALTSSMLVDINGTKHTGPIQPDERIISQARSGHDGIDDTITTAEAWLLEQPACQDAATAAP